MNTNTVRYNGYKKMIVMLYDTVIKIKRKHIDVFLYSTIETIMRKGAYFYYLSLFRLTSLTIFLFLIFSSIYVFGYKIYINSFVVLPASEFQTFQSSEILGVYI